MEHRFWLERWSRGQTGFHQTSVDPNLERYWPGLGLPKGSRVFVPLCGKSLDLLWLRDRGHDVVGIELSELAIEAFCLENGIPAGRRALPPFDRYESPRLSLLRGDFYAASAALLGNVTAIYDRAALVVWPPDQRGWYVAHLNDVAPGTASMLLIALEYPQAEMSGPPFSVGRGEIERLFSRDYDITELGRRDVLTEPRMRDRGLSSMFDVAYRLVRKP